MPISCRWGHIHTPSQDECDLSHARQSQSPEARRFLPSRVHPVVGISCNEWRAVRGRSPSPRSLTGAHRTQACTNRRQRACPFYFWCWYFGETLYVPSALGIKPFAFSEDRIVNPMERPCFQRLRYFRFRLVGRYPPFVTFAPFVPFAPPNATGSLEGISQAQVPPCWIGTVKRVHPQPFVRIPPIVLSFTLRPPVRFFQGLFPVAPHSQSLPPCNSSCEGAIPEGRDIMGRLAPQLSHPLPRCVRLPPACGIEQVPAVQEPPFANSKPFPRCFRVRFILLSRLILFRLF